MTGKAIQCSPKFKAKFKRGALIEVLELCISFSFSKCALWTTWSTLESKLFYFSVFHLGLCVHIECNTGSPFQDFPQISFSLVQSSKIPVSYPLDSSIVTFLKICLLSLFIQVKSFRIRNWANPNCLANSGLKQKASISFEKETI